MHQGNFYITGFTSDTSDVLKIITIKYSSGELFYGTGFFYLRHTTREWDRLYLPIIIRMFIPAGISEEQTARIH